MLKGLEPLLYNPYVLSSVNWFFFGTILETGRRLWQFLVDKFTAGFVLTAVFDTGDPAYDWLAAYLSKQGIWSSTREFKVTARSSTRTWGINSGGATEDGEDAHAEYTPFVDQSQVFRFNGTWCQVKRSRGLMGGNDGHDDGSQLVLTLYTRNRAVLDSLVETAWSQYKHKSQTDLTIHSTCSCGGWCGTSKKGRRPIDSLILPKGLKKMLLTDTKTFMRSQAWYKEAGIQHKRGYLLYGAPGTGKTSTIHALASELDLDIYSLSLATTGVDDNGLARLISSTPANSMILIEDIDCAFPARDKKKDLEILPEDLWGAPAEKKSKITLSGLLNVLDGVSSEEGRLLFATTNYVDRLDAALLRPGRMDVKIHYKLSTRFQIINLFKRFFTITVPLPASAAKVTEVAEGNETKPEGEAAQVSHKAAFAGDDEDCEDEDETVLDIDNAITPPVLPIATVQRLAEQFADSVPANKYSMAELQGYLLTVRTKPFEAVANVGQWMIEMADEKVRIQKKEEEEKEERKKEWIKKKKEEEEKKKKEKSESSSGSTTEQEDSDDEGKSKKKKSKSKKTDEGAKEEETPVPTPTPTTTEKKAAESPAKEPTPLPVVDVAPEEASPASDKGAEEVGSSEGVTTKAEEST
ncbi:hypothetical protein M407DRAFT_67361 [Tulasnella calospora MUT 4182]|uniref:AAA+ ATPase domain-containing protein n=1 Tax=Tulasnella calospora MUT 4182 TaxID=1051891 RepID=A0A0C3QIK1_9AGAM|nr:hypothetical protein M407DRAFT_67361 [Tulasnella calospora MUT 4182]